MEQQGRRAHELEAPEAQERREAGPGARPRIGRQDRALSLRPLGRRRRLRRRGQRRHLQGVRPRRPPRRRRKGGGPVRIRRRPGPEGREDLRPDGRDLRGRHLGPRLEGRAGGRALAPLGAGDREPLPRRDETAVQLEHRGGRPRRREGPPDGRAEVQARDERLYLRRLGGLRGELLRGPVRPSPAGGQGGLHEGGPGRRPPLLPGRGPAREGVHRPEGARRPQGLRPRREEDHQLRLLRGHRRDPPRRHQVHPPVRPELGPGHHHHDVHHQDHLLPADLQLHQVDGPDGRSSSRRSRP